MLEPGLGLMSSLRWPLGMRCGFQALGNRNPTVEGLTHCRPPYKPHQAGLEAPGRTYVATSRHREAGPHPCTGRSSPCAHCSSPKSCGNHCGNIEVGCPILRLDSSPARGCTTAPHPTCSPSRCQPGRPGREGCRSPATPLLGWWVPTSSSLGRSRSPFRGSTAWYARSLPSDTTASSTRSRRPKATSPCRRRRWLRRPHP